MLCSHTVVLKIAIDTVCGFYPLPVNVTEDFVKVLKDLSLLFLSLTLH